jgi:hypothetical protein
MDAVGQATNWSAIAQRAFEIEVNHLETVKEVKSMTDVVERLRASKERFVASQADHGREAGIDWAKKRAEYEELEKIDQVAEFNLCPHGGDDADYAKSVFVTVTGDFAGYPEMADFYGVQIDWLDQMPAGYVDAFIEGARDVWDEVAREL